VLIEVANVRVAPQKPEQLVNDRFDMQLFGGEQRESRSAIAQIKTSLRTKD